MAAFDPSGPTGYAPRRALDDRSLGELFGELTEETRTLVRQEVELAKTELAAKAKVVGRDAGMIGAGGVIAYVGLFFALAGVTIGLGHLIGYGWAALAVGLVLITVGGVLAMKAKRDLQQSTLAPERTKRNLQETKQWIREQTH